MREPGQLLASGRDSDVFEYGTRHVLRRSRKGRSQRYEAETMSYLASVDYPVPAVVELCNDGRDLVMERIDGLTMVDAVAGEPWTMWRRAHELASLHQRLHELAPPAFLRDSPLGAGGSIVHLDLHPLNVLIGPKGPVVIDWGAASRGDPAVDVVVAWALMASARIPGGRLTRAMLSVGRSQSIRAFLSDFDRPTLSSRLRDVVAWKARDQNMSTHEVAAMWRLVERDAR